MSKADEPTKEGFPFYLGFSSMSELRDMVLLVPATDAQAMKNLEEWKRNNGTRDSLMHILGVVRMGDTYIFHSVEARDRWFRFLSEQRQKEYQLVRRELDGELMNDLRELELQRIRAEISTPKTTTE